MTRKDNVPDGINGVVELERTMGGTDDRVVVSLDSITLPGAITRRLARASAPQHALRA